MQSLVLENRPFVPGTTSWRASDLDDSEVERRWFSGRYEIVEGVLAVIPPGYIASGSATFNLMKYVHEYLEREGVRGRLSMGVDIVIDEIRVARADAVLLMPADARRQTRAAKAAGRRDLKRTRILVPPTLVIESVSPGHEEHDRRVKKRWYAEFAVPNYWIVDAFEQMLECLRLQGGRYVRDVKGKGRRVVRPGAFAGLAVDLGAVWEEED
jgi:Uma2 family endonuclease